METTVAHGEQHEEERGNRVTVIERDHIEKVLEQVEGNKSRAAKILEIDRKTLYTKLERYGLDAQLPAVKGAP